MNILKDRIVSHALYFLFSRLTESWRIFISFRYNVVINLELIIIYFVVNVRL